MISSDDLVKMRATMTSIRNDNDVSITIRRGATTLAAQTVRIAGAGNDGSRHDSPAGEETRGKVIVLGSTALDIVKDDRFTVAGVLYVVTFVRPNQTIAIVAEAEAIE